MVYDSVSLSAQQLLSYSTTWGPPTPDGLHTYTFKQSKIKPPAKRQIPKRGRPYLILL